MTGVRQSLITMVVAFVLTSCVDGPASPSLPAAGGRESTAPELLSSPTASDRFASARGASARYGKGFLRPVVAYLPFDGNANDVSGNGHDGELVGSVSPTVGFDERSDGAYHFQAGGYIDIGDLDLPTEFTILLWVRPEAFPDGLARGALIGRFTLPGNWV